MPIHKLQQDAFKIFMAGVQAVSPWKLVSNVLTVSTNKLVVKEKEYNLHKNVHVVAFGKAVLGMVKAVEQILGPHIVQGVASVPAGLRSVHAENIEETKPRQPTAVVFKKVEIIQGAKNNYPDAAAQAAAMKIMNIARSVDKEDILLVLVSGGGSALLPLPVSEITLEEKVKTTKVLSTNGANITELNTVRKHLSQIKGGKLAEAAYPASVITLILSDVLGDPLDIIACGPTVPDNSTRTECLRIIQKLNATNSIPSSVVKYLRSPGDEVFQERSQFLHVHNIVIGNNKIAVAGAASMAEKLGYDTIIHSTDVSGEARSVGRIYAQLGAALQGVNVNSNFKAEQRESISSICLPQNKPTCILGSGETTVSVTGSGRGGRSQELALAAAIEMSRTVSRKEILLLSAGTDGQDGPTPAAGAYAFPHLVTMAAEQHLDALAFLNNNDSFGFYSHVNDGQCLVETGLTGTNVMDLQILLSSSRATEH